MLQSSRPHSRMFQICNMCRTRGEGIDYRIAIKSETF